MAYLLKCSPCCEKHSSNDTPVSYQKERESGEQEDIVLLHPEYAAMLRDNHHVLRQIIHTEDLWPCFMKYGVMDKATEHRIKLNATPEMIVDRLLDHIESGPVWRLHALLRTCSLTHQPHLISLLGLSPETYAESSDSEDHTSKPWSSSNTCSGTGQRSGSFPPRHRNALSSHASYYKNNLMRGRVFDFKHEDPDTELYNIVKCYIKQIPDLEEYKGVAIPIDMENILKPCGEYSRPQTVLLVGHPGTGKSTFCKCFAHSCSLVLLQSLEDTKGKIAPTDHMLVIYVPARSLKSNIWGSIHNNLCCKAGMRKETISKIRSGTLSPGLIQLSILIDGIDEIRDDKILEALTEFITQIHLEGGPQMLVSARTGLSRINKSCFDRFLNLEGFTTDQGVEYTYKYVSLHSSLKQSGKPKEDTVDPSSGVSRSQALDYVDKHKEEMAPILSNPLRTHLFSALSVEGLLKFEKDRVLQFVELLGTMEEFFIMRETDGMGASQQESSQFYQLCLYGLLENVRGFTDDHLRKFNISPSPYLSFFDRQTTTGRLGRKRTFYYFQHEILYEYFAARAIDTLPESTRNAILLYIFTREILRNLQKLIFGMLGDYGTEKSLPLLINMTQILLLKEASAKPSPAHHENAGIGLWNAFSSDSKSLLKNIKSAIPAPGVVLVGEDGKHAIDDRAIVEIWDKIGLIYTQLAELIRTNQTPYDEQFWVTKYFDTLSGFVRTVIMDLLAECTIDQQIEVAKNTYYRMLPCGRLYPGSSMRWMKVSSNYIYCWSPEDIPGAVHHHIKDVPQRATTDKLWVDLRYSPSEWGHVPDEHWAPATWHKALEELLRQYSITGTLELSLPDGCSIRLNGLFTSIAHMDRSVYPKGGIIIHRGDISLSDLHQWCKESDLTNNMKIKLWWTSVHSPADGQTREQLWQWVKKKCFLAGGIREYLLIGGVSLCDPIINFRHLRLPAN